MSKNVVIGNFASSFNKIKNADAVRRELASNILNPQDLTRKATTVKKQLQTTLGGVKRSITPDDLKAFSKAIKSLGKQFKHGVTVQDVIDLSLPIDIKRANQQINLAVPMTLKKNVIHFLTNASSDSKDKRHHVHVEFTGIEAVANTPIALKGAYLALIKSSNIKFDCDCGRHTFWYRYIATTGGFNYGRAETGFPKIRNPNLAGIACKHVLRVMQSIKKDMRVRAMLETAINNQRKTFGKAEVKVKTLVSDAKKDIAEQAKTITKVSASKSRTQQDKAVKTAIDKHVKLMQDKQNKLKTDGLNRKNDALKNINHLKAVFELGIISKAKFEKALKQITESN